MAGAEEFLARTAELSDEVGTGIFESRVHVDQAYAQNQHESLWFRHPNGGMAKYLEIPLKRETGRFLGMIAQSAITPGGSDLDTAMPVIAEEMSDLVENNAPIDTGELYRSGSPEAIDNGKQVYYRPPEVPRGDYH